MNTPDTLTSAARKLNVPPSTLRYWEQCGLSQCRWVRSACKWRNEIATEQPDDS